MARNIKQASALFVGIHWAEGRETLGFTDPTTVRSTGEKSERESREGRRFAERVFGGSA